MMEVSDPIIFGCAAKVFLASVLEKLDDKLVTAGISVNNSFDSLLVNLDKLDAGTRTAVEAEVTAAYAANPDLTIVSSDKGTTNLHVPSDVVIGTSILTMIRNSGRM